MTDNIVALRKNQILGQLFSVALLCYNSMDIIIENYYI